MVLGFMQTVAEDDPYFIKKLSATGIGLDVMCVKIATVQILGNNLIHQLNLGELRVLLGNTLGNPQDLQCFFHASMPDFIALQAKQAADRAAETVITPTIEDSGTTGREQLAPRADEEVFDSRGKKG